MGMAALAPAWRSDVDYTRKSIWDLREIAREQHPDHTPEAARVFVDRILEMESDRRTIHLDARLQGYGTSAIVPGYAPGGTDIAAARRAL